MIPILLFFQLLSGLESMTQPMRLDRTTDLLAFMYIALYRDSYAKVQLMLFSINTCALVFLHGDEEMTVVERNIFDSHFHLFQP